jgi:hypothetical protein
LVRSRITERATAGSIAATSARIAAVSSGCPRPTRGPFRRHSPPSARRRAFPRGSSR